MLLLSPNSKSKLFNRTQTANILLLSTSRNLLTRPRASSETMDSFFLGFSNKYKHTRLCIFKILLQQLNDHQVLEEISSLIILSLCEGKLIKDLTRDSHKQQYEQSSLQRAFGYKTLNTKGGTRGTRGTLISLKTYKNVLGFSLYIGVFYLNPNTFKQSLG